MDRTNDDTTLTWYYVYILYLCLCITPMAFSLLFRSSGEICDLCVTRQLPLDNRVAAAQINNTASNKLLHLTRRNQCVSYRILLHAGSYSNSSETGKHARMSALNLVLFFDFPRSFLQQNFECYITSFPAENVKM